MAATSHKIGLKIIIMTSGMSTGLLYSKVLGDGVLKNREERLAKS